MDVRFSVLLAPGAIEVHSGKSSEKKRLAEHILGFFVLSHLGTHQLFCFCFSFLFLNFHIAMLMDGGYRLFSLHSVALVPSGCVFSFLLVR